MQAISSECRTVRTPMNQIVCINKIGKANDKLEQELGRAPATEELSSEINLSTSKINIALSSVNKSISLDMPFKDEENGCLLDVIPNSYETDKQIINDSVSNEVSIVLSKMPNREADVIRMSFGLGMSPMTLEEIGSRFGIGCERVRQIQKEAIERIRIEYGNDLKELL